MKLLKVPETAAILRVTTQRAYEMLRGGTVPGVVRLGRQVRVDARKLEAWIAAGGQPLLGGWRRVPESLEGGVGDEKS